MYSRLCKRWGIYAGAVLASFWFIAPATAAPVRLPDGNTVDKVDFERHVHALLGRQGCNSGVCHGSFQGKGGLFLSLFAYSPEKDHQAFTKELLGRRVSTGDPEQSLMLLKPSGQLSHGGGLRFAKESWQYQIIREWIAGGARWQPENGKVVAMEVTPAEYRFDQPDQTKQFKVVVEFADGAREDVTWFCEYKVSDEAVAEVSASGEVRGIRPGDTAIVVSYRGNVRAVRALVAAPLSKDAAKAAVAEVNYIDREVFAKLRQLNIVPSDLSSDSEFLRRVYIDTIGCLPAPDEARAFLASKEPDKRARKIDELLGHPLHAALWATKFSDITGNNVDQMEQPVGTRPKRAKMWHDWFRKRIALNVPYDQIVKGVLTATSQDGQSREEWIRQAAAIDQAAQRGFESDYANRATLDLFWRGTNFFTLRNIGNSPAKIEQMAEHTAAAFLGIRIECAQCHKHPLDRWTQADYRGYANIFSYLELGYVPQVEEAVTKVNADRQKARTEALAAVDQENTRRRTAAEQAVDAENAARRKELEAGLAKLDPETRKSALDAVDSANSERKKLALAAVDRDNAARRQEVDAKYPAPPPPTVAGARGPRGLYLTEQPVRQLTHPDTNVPLPPKALGGPVLEAKGDPRIALFESLRRPDHPYFAPSFVNRVWAHYFGVGLVDPVDNFSVANPPSNEKLLAALAKDFVEHNFDIRHLERTILLSRSYQLSAIPNASNRHDRKNYSRAYLRPMMAEVVADVLNSALGVTEEYGADVPAGSRAIEVAPNRVGNPTLNQLFLIFGRPPRTSTCDCERAMEPALPRTLFLMTEPYVLNKITSGRLKQLLADKKADEHVVEELFLATLTRFPKEAEKRQSLEHVQSKPDRQAGFVDIVWALINTREFILNH
jgi:hypothetical protein